MSVRVIGLCEACRYARRVRSSKGAVFWLCERARWDARLTKYPQLPVSSCPGYEPGEPSGAQEAN